MGEILQSIFFNLPIGIISSKKYFLSSGVKFCQQITINVLKMKSLKEKKRVIYETNMAIYRFAYIIGPQEGRLKQSHLASES
jgi:hypothetical protein